MSSFWQRAIEPERVTRPRLDRSRTADVCIVGAGYTGLWTAYELLREAPELEVVIVEAQFAGFGASGRNGGWVVGELAGRREEWSRRKGRAGAIAQERAIRDTVGHIGAVISAEQIDCDFVHGGTLRVAQDSLQHARLKAEIAADRRWGVGPEDSVLLAGDQVAERIALPSITAAIFSPHCARVQPARLAAGLAAAAERRGATIFESSPATAITPGRVTTPGGDLTARHVIRATEGYTARLPGLRRALLPMRSSMIITAPLDPGTWRAIGWQHAETLQDCRHLFVYLQRTQDGRIAIGGRGKPYRFASGTDAEGPAHPDVVAGLRHRLLELFPALRGVEIEASWSGILGVTRRWTPAVAFDPATGLGWAGGYVGDGVAASNLAGRTLRDLILARPSELTTLPWVAPVGRQWEPEPLRWLGVNGIYQLLRLADLRELRTGQASLLSLPARMLGAAH